MQDSCQVFSFPWLELFLHESRVKTLLFLYYSIHDKNKLVKGLTRKFLSCILLQKLARFLQEKKCEIIKIVLVIASTLLYNKYTSKEETMLIQEIKLNNGEKLEIYHDEGCFDPRKEFDNVTEMIFFHNRMNVGDNHDIDPDNYSSFAGMMNENVKDGDLAMPVFCYSKRCFELSLTPFSCPWDSGTLGFIVIRKATIDYEFDGDREKALRNLKAELNTYNDYLNGRTYGGILYDAEGHEIDACWGFYGNDFEENGIYDNFGINKNNIVEVA